jgi:hypothetical protein
LLEEPGNQVSVPGILRFKGRIVGAAVSMAAIVVFSIIGDRFMTYAERGAAKRGNIESAVVVNPPENGPNNGLHDPAIKQAD